MSDYDGYSDNFDEPDMEIQIKTLMGTTFDMKITSTQTIGDIKRRIYRVEGENFGYQKKYVIENNYQLFILRYTHLPTKFNLSIKGINRYEPFV